MSTRVDGLRIVSLVPSITETLRHWGHDPIACTRFCEQPDLATVGGTKNPDLEAIAELGPDVVMFDREENRREDAEAIERLGIEVFVTDVRSLDDVRFELDRLADRLGLRSQTADWPDWGPIPAPRRRAFVPIWRRPWMTIGAATYGSSFLAVLGVENAYADLGGDAYPEVSLDEVRTRRVDIVLAPSEPYVFTPEHLAELSIVAPVVEIDGQDLFWWGSRTPAALDRLRSLIDSF